MKCHNIKNNLNKFSHTGIIIVHILIDWSSEPYPRCHGFKSCKEMTNEIRRPYLVAFNKRF